MLSDFDIAGVIRQLFAQHPIEPQNGIHGRAQLVPHGRHEFIFVRLCREQIFLHGLQGLVTLLHLRQLHAVRAVVQRQHPDQAGGGQHLVEQGPQHHALVVHGLHPPILQTR